MQWREMREKLLDPATMPTEARPNWRRASEVPGMTAKLRAGYGPAWRSITQTLSRRPELGEYAPWLEAHKRELFEAVFLLNQTRPTATPHRIGQAEKFSAMIGLLPELARISGKTVNPILEPQQWHEIMEEILSGHEERKLDSIASALKLAKASNFASHQMKELQAKLERFHDPALAKRDYSVAKILGSKSVKISELHQHVNFAASPHEDYLRELVVYVDTLLDFKPPKSR